VSRLSSGSGPSKDSPTCSRPPAWHDLPVRVSQLTLEGMPEASEMPRSRDTSKSGSPAAAVRHFHEVLNLPIRETPTVPIPEAERELRISLILEEAQEFAEASADQDLAEIADALADLVYVAYGAALHYGIDLDDVIAEVHRANMSKASRRAGVAMRSDGKVLKSSSYRAPDLDRLLDT
jgi:predicted HAD superfamily Cof-like phosphohydrolase